MSLQTMMRMLGKDAPLRLKQKLEVLFLTIFTFTFAFFYLCLNQLMLCICRLQTKALSMVDQFSLPNTQHMISTMAKMKFHSKPLLDVCSKKINGKLFPTKSFESNRNEIYECYGPVILKPSMSFLCGRKP